MRSRKKKKQRDTYYEQPNLVKTVRVCDAEIVGVDFKQVEGSPFIGRPKPGDVRQGGLGDCYFLANLIFLCSTNPELIEYLFREPKESDFKNNVRIRLFESRDDSGILYPVEYVIDNTIPKYENARHGADWVFLLEKAYYLHICRQRKNSGNKTVLSFLEAYEGGGNAHNAMAALTGIQASEQTNLSQRGTLLRFFEVVKTICSMACNATEEEINVYTQALTQVVYERLPELKELFYETDIQGVITWISSGLKRPGDDYAQSINNAFDGFNKRIWEAKSKADIVKIVKRLSGKFHTAMDSGLQTKLVSRISESIDSSHFQKEENKVYEGFYKKLEASECVVAASHCVSNKINKDIVQGHAYAVLHVFECPQASQKYIVLRNPHTKTPVGVNGCTPRVYRKHVEPFLGRERENNNGIIVLPFSDFMRCFDMSYKMDIKSSLRSTAQLDAQDPEHAYPVIKHVINHGARFQMPDSGNESEVSSMKSASSTTPSALSSPVTERKALAVPESLYEKHQKTIEELKGKLAAYLEEGTGSRCSPYRLFSHSKHRYISASRRVRAESILKLIEGFELLDPEKTCTSIFLNERAEEMTENNKNVSDIMKHIHDARDAHREAHNNATFNYTDRLNEALACLDNKEEEVCLWDDITL